MTAPNSHPSKSSLPDAKIAGFSLIEVILALGIFSFVIIPMLGLVSIGMGTLRTSMDDTVRAVIIGEVVGEAQRTLWAYQVERFDGVTYYYSDEGVRLEADSEKGVFVVETNLSDAPDLLPSTSKSRLLTVTVRHFADSQNQLIQSQLLVKSEPSSP